MKKKIDLEIELRGNRLYLIHKDGVSNFEIDISPVWTFFKESIDYLKEPYFAPCAKNCEYECYLSAPNVHDCGCHGSVNIKKEV